jgi:hypothetical protein
MIWFCKSFSSAKDNIQFVYVNILRNINDEISKLNL